MIVYVALILGLPLAWAGVRRWAPGQETRFVCAAWAILTLVIGLRYETGGDWDHYLLMLQRARLNPLPGSLAISDPGYMLLNEIAAAAGLGLWIVNLVCAGIFAAGLLLFARRQASPPLALLIAGPVLILIGAINATRQAAAVALFMWSIDRHLAARTGAASALLVAAFLFHWSAALLLPLILLMRLRRPLPFWLLPAVAAAGGCVLLLGVQLVPAAAQRVGTFAFAAGAWARLLPTIAALGLLLLFWRRLAQNPRERLALSYLAAVAIFALGFLPLVEVAADRFGYYSIPFQMWVLSGVAALAPPGWRRRAAEAVVAAPFVAMFAGWLALTGSGGCMLPYRSYLERPDLLLPLSAPEPPRPSSACADVFGIEGGGSAPYPVPVAPPQPSTR